MRYTNGMRAFSVVGLLGACVVLGVSLFVQLAHASAPVTPVVAMTVESPENVARGDAFLVTASVGSPMLKMTFEWMGKQHVVPTVTTSSLGGRAYARMLLPVPMDAEGASQTLVIKAGGMKPVTRQVAIITKDRPVQKLTVDKKFTSPPVAEKARIAEDRRKVAEVVARYTPKQDWTLPLLRPVAGDISGQFGLRREYNGVTKSIHRGLDMRSPAGTPVPAIADGEVVLADGLYYSGNAVYIDHGLGVVTSYMHMSELMVEHGQKVKRGDIIGKVGSTGQSTGPHLHLGLMVLGTAVDPVPFMEAAAPQKAQ